MFSVTLLALDCKYVKLDTHIQFEDDEKERDEENTWTKNDVSGGRKST
jgi:hypothetical protein